MNAAEIMRSYIIDIETYSIAEQAGMFCESLKENLDDSLFKDTKFCYYEDEPYEVSFIWDRDELRIQLTFKGDSDDSTWLIINGKRRFRGQIKDIENSCRTFLDTLKEMTVS